MVKKFNKSNLPEIRAEMRCALKGVEEKFGTAIEVGHCSFTDNGATFKVKLSILDEAGVSKADKEDFMSNALFRGFDGADFGRDFTHQGRQFKITGWNTRRWKFPVVVREVATGRKAYFPIAAVLRLLRQ